MPLQTQVVQVDFTGELDTKSDKRAVVQGNFRNLENCVYTKIGSLRKRPGNRRLTRDVVGGATLPAARTIVGYQDSLLFCGPDKIYALNEAETVWDDQGFIPEPIVRETILTSTSVPVSQLTSAKGNGVSIYLYSYISTAPGDPGVIYTSVVDASGSVISNGEKLNTLADCRTPRIVIAGTFAFALYIQQGGTNLYYRRLDLTNPVAWGPETVLPNAIDVFSETYEVVTLGSTFVVVYQRTLASPTGISIRRYDTIPAQTDSYTALASSVTQTINQFAVAVDEAANSMWIAYSTFDGLGSYFIQAVQMAVNPGFSVSTAEFQVYGDSPAPGVNGTILRLGIALRSNPNTAVVVASTNYPINSPGYFKTISQSIEGGSPGTNIGLRRYVYSNIILVTKPFRVDEKIYVGAADLQDHTYFILDTFGDEDSLALTPLRPVATFCSQRGDLSLTTGKATVLSSLSSVVQSSASEYLLPAISTGQTIQSIGSYRATFGGSLAFTESDDSMIFAGGVPSSFDGARLAELDFLVRPVILSAVAGGPGTLPADTYRYKVTYEWTDSKGQKFISAPSDTSAAITLGAPGRITLVINYLSLTTKQATGAFADSVQVVIYFTAQSTGTIFRRLLPTNLLPDYQLNLNNLAASNFTFVHSAAIADSARTVLYTQTELINVPPPSAEYAVVHAGRLWLLGVDDGTQIWPSKKLIEGSAPAFSTELTFNIHEGGPITGVASMDDKLVVFKENRIFVVFGDGPNNNNTGTEFAFQRVSSDIGCDSGTSIVTSKEGTFFRSLTGISMLSRGLLTSYVGAPVEDSVKEFSAGVSSAISHPTNTWILFTLGPDEVGAGVVVVYDYFQNKWSKWYLTDTFIPQSQAFVQSATLYKGLYTWVTADGVPYIESDEYLDDGAYVSMTIETSWIRWGSMLGFQRVRQLMILGQSLSPHNLEISLGANYDENSYSQINTFGYEVLNWNSEQFGVKVVQQKCSSISVKIRDLESGISLGTGQGLSVNGLTFEVGLKQGEFKLPIVQGG